jgi:AcrR family transcriptional regulator
MSRTSDPRAEYVAIATKAFAEDGYHGTSLAALARRADVTKQALLHFFNSKERLYAEVLTALAERQCAQIDSAARPDAAEHLIAYFDDLRVSALDRPEDSRLVVRALLESNEGARVWPLKSYLDKLVALARKTPGGAAASEDQARAWVFQMFGAIQYLAISTPTISGMYGREATRAVAVHFEDILHASVRNFTAGTGGMTT